MRGNFDVLEEYFKNKVILKDKPDYTGATTETTRYNA
jgi:hypothetical protein